MVAVRGIIQGNTVVVEDEDIKRYDGKDVPIRCARIYKGDAEQ